MLSVVHQIISFTGHDNCIRAGATRIRVNRSLTLYYRHLFMMSINSIFKSFHEQKLNLMIARPELIRLIDCDDCLHNRPINRCPPCQMLTFLIIRRQLHRDGFPFLIRDVCQLILKRLPPYTNPPKGAAWRLRDCGKHYRPKIYPNRGPVPNAICGFELVTTELPNQILYCMCYAVVANSKCGTWACNRHSRRQTILAGKAGADNFLANE